MAKNKVAPFFRTRCTYRETDRCDRTYYNSALSGDKHDPYNTLIHLLWLQNGPTMLVIESPLRLEYNQGLAWLSSRQDFVLTSRNRCLSFRYKELIFSSVLNRRRQTHHLYKLTDRQADVELSSITKSRAPQAARCISPAPTPTPSPYLPASRALVSPRFGFRRREVNGNFCELRSVQLRTSKTRVM